MTLRVSIAFVLLATGSCQKADPPLGPKPPDRAPPLPALEQVPEPVIRDAVRAAHLAVTERPQSAEVWGHYGDLLARYGWNRRALLCYQVAAEQDPRRFEWHYRQGLLCLDADPDRAAKLLEQALALDGNYWPAYVHLGRARIEQSQPARARQAFEFALQQNPNSVDALLGIARLDLLAGKPGAAAETLQTALELEPEHSDLHETMARVQFAAGNPDEAERSAKLARAYKRQQTLDDPRAKAELEPLSSRDFLNHGVEAINDGRFDDALAAFQEAYDRNPDDYEILFNLGLTYLLTDDPEQAEYYLRLCLNIHPDYVPARMRLGRLLIQQERYEDARQQFYKMLEIDPTSARAHRYLGESYAHEREFTPALMHSEKALELSPDTPAMRYQYAFQLMESRNFAEAAKAFQHLLDLEPNHYMGHNNLGIALGEMGQSEAALEHFRFCLQVTPDNPGVKRNIAISASSAGIEQFQAGDYDAAIKSFEECLQHSDEWLEVERMLAWCLAAHPDESRRDPARALELARDVLVLQPTDPDNLDTVAVAYAANGDFTKALEYAERAREAAEEIQRDGLVRRIDRRIRKFQKGRPYVERNPKQEDG